MNITFTAAHKDSELFIPPPMESSNFLPDWFKNIPAHEPGYDGNKLSRFAFGSSRTIKGCIPFLDTLTGGYTFQLAADVEFSFENGTFVPKWLVDFPIIERQSPIQAAGMPAITPHTEDVFKWIAGWKITTPKGYSTLFTHPLNRHDLPFRTFSGIVDTDTYKTHTDFPFQIQAPETESIVLIKKGTPICQAIPFKRDDWKSSTKPYSEEEEKKNTFDLFSTIDRSYKNRFWTKKNYE